ncbi:hypothetical protein BT63DRAFT_211243 [Microthyrium microscopicum]|uniref:Fms interacting protein n=1 Tax=Microthyrium microscopicum TaxID=703497 RepID=A0A6A6UG45_9PEZI|nr:hypothetical protein BT63DRAFT_211243 [Microthyrium microscopicum]
MASPEIVTDADLATVLETIDILREQALNLLELQESTLRDLRNGADATGSTTPSEDEMRYIKDQQALFGRAGQVRTLYRNAVMSTRSTKQTTSDARAEVDRLHLQLQNLIYEQRHLTGEIAACEGYKHKYTNLPLIPVEDFISMFPDKSDLSEHDLMIQRIEHEYAERQALEEKRQGLLKRKQGLIAENNRRKEDLANLDKDLEKFIEAADPIIKTFEKEY